MTEFWNGYLWGALTVLVVIVLFLIVAFGTVVETDLLDEGEDWIGPTPPKGGKS